MDPIAQLVTNLKNASLAKKPSVRMPSSIFKEAILQKLKERGFVKSVGQEKEKGMQYLTAELGPIIDITRLSKPSRRIYMQARKIPLYRAKQSKILLSTPKGLLFDYEARKQNVGGEVVLEIS